MVAELPSRPLLSLGELVNWDLRFDNPCPPFAFNLVGNSDATPLVSANAVVNSSEASMADNLRVDDCYCANHLLFDDWFLSSITPDPASFGASLGAGGRNQQTVYTDFVTGKTPLANRAYEPIQEDRAKASTNPPASANAFYTQNVNKTEAWRTIASRLEVAGMFNVNSTSVPAWRALLGHARNQRVPYIRRATGSTWDIVTVRRYPARGSALQHRRRCPGGQCHSRSLPGGKRDHRLSRADRRFH